VICCSHRTSMRILARRKPTWSKIIRESRCYIDHWRWSYRALAGFGVEGSGREDNLYF
jgi:hypothetical protein